MCDVADWEGTCDPAQGFDEEQKAEINKKNNPRLVCHLWHSLSSGFQGVIPASAYAYSGDRNFNGRFR
jgi:hypothetical protein